MSLGAEHVPSIAVLPLGYLGPWKSDLDGDELHMFPGGKIMVDPGLKLGGPSPGS